jgi:ferric-dicitrate binding protein FerR (iron transport regulator)
MMDGSREMMTARAWQAQAEANKSAWGKVNDLQAEVAQLSDEECRFILIWLAEGGPDHRHGQAVLTGIAAVKRVLGKSSAAVKS